MSTMQEKRERFEANRERDSLKAVRACLREAVHADYERAKLEDRLDLTRTPNKRFEIVGELTLAEGRRDRYLIRAICELIS